MLCSEERLDIDSRFLLELSVIPRFETETVWEGEEGERVGGGEGDKNHKIEIGINSEKPRDVVRDFNLGNLSTNVRELRTVTGTECFLFRRGFAPHHGRLLF